MEGWEPFRVLIPCGALNATLIISPLTETTSPSPKALWLILSPTLKLEVLVVISSFFFGYYLVITVFLILALLSLK